MNQENLPSIQENPIKILVVDDEIDLEPLILQKFRKKIRNGEYNFLFAHNGLEALASLIKNPEIGIILTDINMPEMDGLTLLLKLKEIKNPTLKTVVVSAYGDMENIRTAMNRGAFDFLTKPISFEDLELTIDKTLEEIKGLRKSIIEHEQLLSIQQDLSIAREIQHSILPKVFPPFPNKTEFDIYATMTPAKEVGGDFYDFFLIDNDRLGLVIGDVSGKGIPAAIFMAVSRTIIRATGLKGMTPNDCLNYVNNLICNGNDSCMFVTVFYGILNLKTGELEYTNAGHNNPYLLKDLNQIIEIQDTNNIALGIINNFEYSSKKIIFSKNDVLFLFTDGITEAFNVDGQIFGNARLQVFLKGAFADDPEKLINKMLEEIDSFSIHVPQSDDITLLSIKYLG